MLMKEVVLGLHHSKCDGMSQYDLMEDDNRLPSIVVKDKLTFTLMQKEQVNLCLVERSNVMLTISYILLIIVSDHNKLNKNDKNIRPGAISRPRCKNMSFIYFTFPKIGMEESNPIQHWLDANSPSRGYPRCAGCPCGRNPLRVMLCRGKG